MQKISIDIETFSDVDLIKCGVYKYADSPAFEILLFAYSIDDGEIHVVDLLSGETLLEEITEAIKSDTVIKTAFNAQFERVCLSKHLGLPDGEYLNPQSWYCTAVQAAELSLPSSLADVGVALGLERQKMTEGKDLIKYFCVPCKPTKSNGGRVRNMPCDSPEKWEMFKEYCKRDVDVERQIAKKLEMYPISESEHRLYVLDQNINDRGVFVDLELARQAVKLNSIQTAVATEQAYTLTGLENPNSVAQLKAWLTENGVEIESLSKKAVAALADETDGDIQEMLHLRLLMSKTSVKKYEAVMRSVCTDSRVRGMMRFCGASRTGRWSGQILQVQNLPRNYITDLTLARDIVKNGDFELLDMIFGNVPNVLSELIRTVLIPKLNHRFIVADFSAIEARVLSWLAGEQWRLDTFRNGGDIYCASASQMFRVPVEKHGVNGHLRQKGKISELACIAEGQLVLTDAGLIPIEKVTLAHKLWDGEDWVSHDGVIYKGEHEVITYEGLTATKDHLVWVEGESKPIQFGVAASCGAHLVQTGD
ncbi:MAG: DNA polymerase, partial [Oscillospiraceae bacterium]